MAAPGWFLERAERGNPATVLGRRHPDDLGWSEGNRVRPLVHGATYFAELAAAVQAQHRDDVLLFTDWRGDPDEALGADGLDVSSLLCQAAARGVVVRGLVWRSHMDRLRFSDRENRHLGEEIEAAGGICLLDMRVRPGGSHHQKFVVLRHPDRPSLDVAFVGGIDLCHSRRDTSDHSGDPQAQPMAAVYGRRPPWHDIQLEVRGPAVGDIEASFRERWSDPSPLSRNPLRLIHDRLDGSDGGDRRLPAQLPDPAPAGDLAVQVLRTYPRRRPGYPFAPKGERSVARGVAKAVSRARRLIYLEDQFLWSEEVASTFCDALVARPDLRLIAVLPLHPNAVGRTRALRALRAAGGDRVGVFGIENHEGTPVYVHAKVCVVDDTWASVGSDNINRRSWTYDSEISCAVTGGDGGPDRRSFAQGLRLQLAREHLDRAPGDDVDVLDPASAFTAFSDSAAALDRWHRSGGQGPRLPGRLRVLHQADGGVQPLTPGAQRRVMMRCVKRRSRPEPASVSW